MKKPKKKSQKKTSRAKVQPKVGAPSSNRSPANNAAFSHVLLWFGAVLTVFTFLGGLQTVIDFSPWASWLLRNWMGILEAVWSKIFFILGMKPEKDAIIPGTFIFSMLFMAFGAMLFNGQPSPQFDQRPRTFLEGLFDHEINHRRAEGLAVGSVMALAAITVINWYLFDAQFSDSDLHFWWMKWGLLVAVPILFITLFFESSFSDYCHLILLTFSMVCLYMLMLVPAANEARIRGGDELWRLAFMVINLSVFLFPSKMMTLLTIARPRFWNYRMIYVWCTIALLLALDWVARASISLYPPK